nr:YegS/Rv2252/BmrU family lipid kinase [uncultured Cellulosilyticum sp.]
MKKEAILLYNPKAGHRTIKFQIDLIAQQLQELGYGLRLFRSAKPGDIKEYIIEHITTDNTDLILIAGGDGTVNECITGMGIKDIDIPILILPVGTANDFANSAGIPCKIQDTLNLIKEDNLKYIDIGKVNDKYFVNVCNMGLFSGVSHTVDLEMKKRFGRLAYYFKGFEEVQNYQAMDMTITTDHGVLNEKYILVLVFNGKGAGGMLKLAKDADIRDGKFNLVCIKDVGFFEVPGLFLKVLQGEHLDDSRIDYFTSSQAKIECHNQDANGTHFVTDVDGEEGPAFPLNIEVIEDKFRVYLPVGDE